MKEPALVISRTILKNTRCASPRSKACCIPLKRFFGLTRRFGKPFCPTSLGARPPSRPMVHINFYLNRTLRGKVIGPYDLDGSGTETRKMHGTGTVGVTNGDVFAIPVFGPISEILNHIVPGAGYSIARDAGAKFTIRDGIIRSDDINVSGQLFSVLGHGDVYFLDDKLDLDVRISAKGPGIVLAPVYKLFEYKAEGSMKKPDWHPKRF